MSSSSSTLSKAKGAFYGNLIGDALGAPVEFQPRDSFPPVTGMQVCDTWGLPAGSFTDDGSLMLCLAASIVNAGGKQDPNNQLGHYLAWYRDGHMSVNGECFDIGHTTQQAIVDYANRGLLEAETTDEFQAGNGSVMRLAPIPVVFHNLPLKRVWAEGAASSKTTHAAAAAVWGCGFWATLTAMAIQGRSKAELINWIRQIPYNSSPEIANYPIAWKRMLDCRFLTAPREEIKSGGYVVDSCEAALWAFFRTSTFAEGACLAVNLGKDTDTVGAIYGILAGAFYGYEGIPEDWLATLQMADVVAGVWKDLEPYVGNIGIVGNVDV
jgi:ADP-ribosyl-[dinitrogen reductase] hydrolase